MNTLRLRRLAIVASFSLAASTGASAQESAAPASAPAAAPAAAPAQGAAAETRRPRRDRNKITAQEIAERTETDLLAVVRRARPQWLRVRGRESMNLNEQVWVYLDGRKIGGVGELGRMRSSEAIEIQHMDGAEATQRYGLNHGAGAIFVRTR